MAAGAARRLHFLQRTIRAMSHPDIIVHVRGYNVSYRRIDVKFIDPTLRVWMS